MTAGTQLASLQRCLVISVLAALCLLPGKAASQTAARAPAGAKTGAHSRTLAERLGYPPDAKLLIVHADDLAVAHSVDAASIKAFESGLVNSGSIMVNCPWLSEIAVYARTHPEADLGLHLTLTSEWALYRWGPVMSKDRVLSLINRDGYFYPSQVEATAHMNPEESEVEIRAQVERARLFGIESTHLDSHMGTLFSTKALFDVLMRVAHDYKLPVLVSRDFFARANYLQTDLGPNDIPIDRMVTIQPTVPPEGWAAFYTEAVKNLTPGGTEFIIHLAYDDEEMRAITVEHPDWGAAWRQRDFDFFTSAAFRRLLDENNVKLVTWREIVRQNH
jgi:predicted glycoside hydrolase/deacetylase ChbG (UPF0249 family)